MKKSISVHSSFIHRLVMAFLPLMLVPCFVLAGQTKSTPPKGVFYFVQKTQFSFVSSVGDCSGLEHCSASTSPLQSAIAATVAGLAPDDGVIYLSGIFNENVFVTDPGFDLTLTGLSGRDSAVINGSINIVAGKGGITLKNVTVTDHGGSVKIEGRDVVIADSVLDVSGQDGGKVQILGQEISLRGTTVNADGIYGGGQVNIGGSKEGKGPLPNAVRTVVDDETMIFADALHQGEGGAVIVWGEKELDFGGTISTRGGNGGFAEVSTHGSGIINGRALTGSMLVDPGDVCVTTNNATNCTAGAVSLASATIKSTLDSGGTFTLNTDSYGSSGTGRVDFGGSGNLIVNNNTGTKGTFIIHAADSITTYQVGFISNGTTGTNYEWYGGSSSTSSPVATADVFLYGQTLDTGGGYATFVAADDVKISDPLLTKGGVATLIAKGGDGSAELIFGSTGNQLDDYVDTTDGSGNAGEIFVQTDSLVNNSSANPILNAYGTGGSVTFDPTTAGAVSAGDDNGGLYISQANWDKVSTEKIVLGDTTATTAYLDNLSPPPVITVAADPLLNVLGPVTTSNNDLTLMSDEFTINSTVNAGSGTLMFERITPGILTIAISPGTSTSGADLDTDELGLIYAGSLILGDPVAAQNNVTALNFRQSTDYSGNFPGFVQGNALYAANSYILIYNSQTFHTLELNATDGLAYASGGGTLATTVGDIVLNVDEDGTTAGSDGFNDLLAQNNGNALVDSAGDIYINTRRYREFGTATLSLDANGGAGTVYFQRSSSGTMGVGDGASGGLTFSSSQLGRMTAAAINFGNTAAAQNETTTLNVNAVSLGGINTVNFYTQSSGTTAFSGSSSFANVTTNTGTTTVNTGAALSATNTLAFNATTVNLDGNLTATGGISGTASTVNVLGSSGGAQIQDGIDVAASGGSIIVSADTYSGSFSIDSAGLTIDGSSAAGISPGSLNTSGGVVFSTNSDINVEIGGTTPGTGHDQYVVTGAVTIASSADLLVSSYGGYTPSGGESFIIISNDGTDAVSGAFSGLSEGAAVSDDFLGSGLRATISYVGGDGNDVALTVNLPPDLQAAKSNNVSGNTALGGNWTWKVAVTNTGAGPAYFDSGETIFTDDLPNSGLSYGSVSISNAAGISGTGAVSCSIATSTITCSAVGGTITIGALTGGFDVGVTATPSVTSTFGNPRSSGTCAVDPSGVVTESDETNNSCSDAVTVIAPDLQASKTNNVSGATSRGDINDGAWTWTIVLTNAGSDAAVFSDGETIFRDSLPNGPAWGGVIVDTAGASSVTNAANISCAIVADILTCTASGASVTMGAATASVSLSFSATPGSTGAHVNLSSTCAIDPDGKITEGNEGNNSCADTVTVTAPDLSVSKANDVGSSTSLGDENTGAWIWTATISNSGTGEAVFADGETIFSDQLPAADISYGSPSVGSMANITNSGNISCSISADSLLTCSAVGANVTIGASTGAFSASFAASPAAAGTFINPTGGTCSVDPDGRTIESNESNNSCNVDAVAVGIPDLQAVKSNDVSGAIAVGEDWNWTITVSNSGDGDAVFTDGEQIFIDEMPDTDIGYGAVSTLNIAGISGSGTLTCSSASSMIACYAIGGTVRIGAVSGTFDVATLATPTLPGLYANPIMSGTCAVDANSRVSESDETNNSCSDSVEVKAPDLTVSKVNDSHSKVKENRTFNWVITIKNLGSSKATFNQGDVILLDELPADATYGSPTADSFANFTNSGDVTCVIDSTPALTCSVTGLGPVVINPWGRMVVTIPIADSGLEGTLINPHGICAVDPGGVIVELAEGNNDCSDTVAVTPFPWWTFWHAVLEGARQRNAQQ